MIFPSALLVVRPDAGDRAIEEAIAFIDGGHLEILVVAPAPPAPTVTYDMGGGTVWMEADNAARAEAKDRAEAVEKILARAGCAGGVTDHVASALQLADLIAAAARATDVILLPKEGLGEAGFTRAILNGALFESGTPALAWPAGAPPAPRPRLVTVAWNATPEAAHAVRAAMPLLKAAEEVVLLLVDPSPEPRGHSQDPGAEMARYLGHHGLKPEVLKLPSEGRRAEEVIAAHMRERGPDALVMGAYGHTRLRERIFGGTTHALLDDAPGPLFLAH